MTWRSALLLLVPLALLAAGSDAALYWSVRDHYARHGHLGLALDLALMALAFTGATVYGAIALWRELNKGTRTKPADKSAHSPGATRKGRTKE